MGEKKSRGSYYYKDYKPECEQLLKKVIILAEKAIYWKGQQICPYCGFPGTHSRECVLSKARLYLAKMRSLRNKEAPKIYPAVVYEKENIRKSVSESAFYDLFKMRYSSDGARCLYNYFLNISFEECFPYKINDRSIRSYAEYKTLEACLEDNEVDTLEEIEEMINVIHVIDRNGNHTGRYIVGV